MERQLLNQANGPQGINAILQALTTGGQPVGQRGKETSGVNPSQGDMTVTNGFRTPPSIYSNHSNIMLSGENGQDPGLLGPNYNQHQVAVILNALVGSSGQ